MRPAKKKALTATAEEILNPQPSPDFIGAFSSSFNTELAYWTVQGSQNLDQLAAESQSIDQQDPDAEFAAIEIPGTIGAGNDEAAAFNQFRSFTAALVEDQRINDALKNSLTDALKNGNSFEQWQQTIDQQFDKLGVTRFSTFRLNLIYRTESSLAYGAAQFARLQQIKTKFPYWEYSAILDQRTRPSHRKLHGKIFRADDAQFWPPLGFNCRCTVILITKRQAEQRGIKADLITPEMRSSIANAEFIGDKTGSYNDWLKEQQRGMTQAALNLLTQAFDQLIQQLQTITQ